MVHKVTTRKSLTDTSIDNLLSAYAQVLAANGLENVKLVSFVMNNDYVKILYDITK